MLKNFCELRDEQENEFGVISQKIEKLENQIDNHDRNPAKVEEQKTRLDELERLRRWRGKLTGAIEVNKAFGKEQNGEVLVFDKIDVMSYSGR